ncbi:MAG: hypothetical protein ACFN27_02400, partial [Prevotella sp.]
GLNTENNNFQPCMPILKPFALSLRFSVYLTAKIIKNIRFSSYICRKQAATGNQKTILPSPRSCYFQIKNRL